MTSRRASDRWVTPWVVVVLILAGTVVVLAVVAAVTYLTARGYDPQPVVQLTGTLVAAAGAVGSFLLNLAGRRTVAKVERNTGVLGNAVVRQLEELEEARGAHAYPRGWTPEEELQEEERGTAPAAAQGRDLDQDAGASLGPSRGPSNSSERYRDTPRDGLQDTAWFRQ